MKLFKDMEQFFEKHIEGFFRKHFASGIQPVEIGKKLIRAMEENLQISVTKTYAPNHYIVGLNPADLKRMELLEVPLTGELAEYIAKRAEQQQISFADVPKVEMREDPALAPGELKIEVGFTQAPAIQKECKQEQEAHQGTQVFKGIRTIQDAVKPKGAPCACLRAREGIDSGKEWELGNHRHYIGRRQTNEIALNDINASRVHAYIVLEDGRHVLHDAKSLNGTYVNDERIVRKMLSSGDCIKIGHSILVYEVM